ncbi:zinc finger BED domain-containing protein 5-like [Rhopalosiphum padi]|uniref:zinc finger BED domain-containing protein 5-like n=1 Tax=Rhopalosiphum padi TaxID=40932 RepID=UPI00298EB635|nr:zinc finger BED domain-containing protein 5-like [Rhopalosiphum padi]
MTGKHGGVATKIKLVTENCTFIHCSIHREALVVKRMPEPFKLVLQEIIKVVKFIKSRALQSRLFTKLCSEMGSDHIQLLLHTEVRWLSRGRMLCRLFELHSEVQLFLGETNFELKDKLTDNLWITTLAYLSDIFNRLNVLNLSLQGKSINRFSMNDKIKAFIKIIEMISNNVSNENLQSFPNLEQFVTEHELQVEADLIKNIKHNCKMLKTTFEEYFKEDYSEFFWIRNPFILDLDDIPKTLTNNEKESLIELSCDESLKIEFTKLELGVFWIKIKNEYPLLSKIALLFLLPFTTTYLCETGFSSMIEVKNKFRNKLNLEPNLRLKLSNTEPDISSLISNLQIHGSH